MCKIEFIKKHKGMTIGFIIGIILSLLPFIRNIPLEMFLIFSSFPFAVVLTIEMQFYNNVLPDILFGVITVLYSSILGEVIFRAIRSNRDNKKKRYIILITIIFVVILIQIFSYIYINRISDRIFPAL